MAANDKKLNIGVVGGFPRKARYLFFYSYFVTIWWSWSSICFRFGSVIAGAFKSKLFAKRDKTGETKDALRKRKPKRGSFSFQGGMQVLYISFEENPVLCLFRAIDHLNVFISSIHIFHLIYLIVCSTDADWYTVQRAWQRWR